MPQVIHMRKTGLLAALSLVMAVALAGCGGGSDQGGAFQSPTGGGTGGTTTPVVTPASLVLTASATSIPSDGSIPATVTALVRDSSNVVLKNVAITLQASSGALSVGQGVSDEAGQLVTQLSTGGDRTARNITVTAKAATFTATVTVAVGAPVTNNTVAALTVVSSAPSIPSDGSATSTIVAIARDANNLLMQGVPVSFAATSGGLAVTQGITDASGQAVATLSTAGDSTSRSITVTATVGPRSATTVVTVAQAAPSTTVNLGNGTGSTFVSGALALGSTSLSAGGSTSLVATVVQSDGTLYTKPVTVTFNSPCVAANTAAIQPQAAATTTTGQVSVTYAAKGCSGTDVITATASVGTQNLTATGTVTVAQAVIGSISFVSASPTNIALKGTGDATRSESSTVVFKVLDATGGPRPGASVSFALNTSVGGIALQPSSATAVSDAQGLAQIVVNAGTVATSVKVTATVTSVSPQISTQSSQLTVTTGIPTAGSFSLAVGCFNVEGLNYDGITTSVTARLADRFGNPVPDGTAATFTTEGGAIQAQCTTTTTSTEGGVCTVNWRSSNPRPSNGRVSVLGKAIGEESFTDQNGNGAFDVGEAFTDSSELFRDDNEDGVYTAGLDGDFFDFNNNGTRDGPDGLFNGVLCNDAARCGGAASRSVGIGAGSVIILSGSAANITDTAGAAFVPIVMTTGSSRVLSVWVRDVNGNVMPGGTKVTVGYSGGGVTVGTPASYTVPCSNQLANTQVSGSTVFSFPITNANTAVTAATGFLSISVLTPNGTTSVVQIPVTAN